MSLQIDKTRIAVRQRSYAEILDLALRVIRTSPGVLGLLFVVGVAPAMLLNRWLLADLAEADLAREIPFAYLWHMMVLVVWQAPLVTAPATVYLGKALFMPRPSLREVFGDLRGFLGQLVYYQGLLRGLLLLLLLYWYLEGTEHGLRPFYDPSTYFMMFLVYVVWFVWITRSPYLDEVILLERNPMRASRPGQMTTKRRSRDLHARGRGDFQVRWMGAAAVAALLTVSVWFSISILRGLLLNQREMDAAMFVFYYPLALWIVACYFSVVRFLSYLDLRIYSEGWDVELAMYAERDRLQGLMK